MRKKSSVVPAVFSIILVCLAILCLIIFLNARTSHRQQEDPHVLWTQGRNIAERGQSGEEEIVMRFGNFQGKDVNDATMVFDHVDEDPAQGPLFRTTGQEGRLHKILAGLGYFDEQLQDHFQDMEEQEHDQCKIIVK